MAVPIAREPLIAAVTGVLAGFDTATLDAVRVLLEREIDAAGPGALSRLGDDLDRIGGTWDYNPRNVLARRIHHVLAERVLDAQSSLCGVEHLADVADRPVVVIANHLSYSDANLLDVLLNRTGARAFADRLTVIAGPKVYSTINRRFSSLCFGTIMVPQSADLSSEEAVMNPREVARAARVSINIAHDRLRRGDALLVFGEGSRSRTRQMQPLLPAVARYLEVPDVLVLPVGIVGTDELFPIGQETVKSVAIHARIGQPIDVATLREASNGDRRTMMDAVGHQIARLLPLDYRGTYANAAGG